MFANLQQIFLNETTLSVEAFNQAVSNSKKDSITLLHAIENLNVLQEDQILDIFSRFYRVHKVNLAKMDIPDAIISIVPKDLAQKYRLIPLDRAGNNLIVAMGDPKNMDALEAVRFKCGYLAKPVLASEIRLSEAFHKYYAKMDLTKLKEDAKDGQFTQAPTQTARRTIGSGTDNKEDGPLIKLVNEVLIKCLSSGASDIHFEAYEDFMRIRLRIDGSLVEIARPPITIKSALISRVKIMSGLNIAETRLPQDGAININVGEKPLDFRVSTLPTLYGEKIVMRILDKSNLKVDMTLLGLETEQLVGFKNSIYSPHGMVLVTGPTGSGKTTTLYSALQELNQEDGNVMTAEDPVEYNLPGVNQVQMKPEIGLNFSSALRAFLRQDPDVIMVGEVRDLETAEIAIKAALTGHLVLSTLHTNSAPDTISRLLNMGVAPFNLVASLNCITAQRLMKKICTRCKEEDPSVTREALLTLGVEISTVDSVKAYKGKGCAACNNSGGKGRVAVHEVLIMNDEVKRAILNGAAAIDLKKIAMSTGMKSLRQSALSKMIQGIVTAEEVVKVTSPDK
nr:type IV-A pilus assembly ATPase PilB [Oligoflexales bacterium]